MEQSSAMEDAGCDAAEFDWLTLDEDEEVVWSGRPDPRSVYTAYAIGIPLIPLVGLGLLIIGSAYLYQKNTHYVVTTDGLYKKTGVLSRDVQKIDFDKVQNISFSEGVVGKYFGFGNVDISTAGGSGVEMQFQAVTDPKQVQERINKRIKQSRGTRDEDEPDKEDVLDEILTELQGIRQSFERMEGGQSAGGRSASGQSTTRDRSADRER
ncbi:PH domain-containing protein [Haloarchaeobius sp. DFWS5]|uniref:PH domain-containing protein n=1 Tax=Haloarchaeobius sp. DFWS5 TaxID=3446114 RepID=UPI003EBE3854